LNDWRVCPHTAPDVWRDGYDVGFPVKPPPTIVVTDLYDPLRDEGLVCAKAILEAGCPDFLHVEGAASHTLTTSPFGGCPKERQQVYEKFAGWLRASAEG